MEQDPFRAIGVLSEQLEPLNAQDVLAISNLLVEYPEDLWARELGFGVLISLVTQLDHFIENYTGEEIKALAGHKIVFKQMAKEAAAGQVVISLKDTETTQQEEFKQGTIRLKKIIALAENALRQEFVHGQAIIFRPAR
ncbi:MAG: hypothetical protein GC136_10110 [Alphaproteobacteria bacterium]|nr:hypothetical protein [Alphaproteobacteria bacterium]